MVDNNAVRGLQRSQLEHAIARALDALHKLQKNDRDGAFHSECVVGPHLSANAHLVMYVLGCNESGDTERLHRYVEPLQLPNGAFAENPADEHGSLVATAGVWGSLAATGFSQADPMMMRARRWIDSQGGLSSLATQPMGIDPWGVGPLLAYAGIIDSKNFRGPFLLSIPTWIPGFVSLGSCALSTSILVSSMWRLTLISAIQHRDVRRPLAGLSFWLREVEQRRVLTISQEFQNPDGGWFGVLGLTTVAMAALNALGVSPDHPVLQAAIQWVQSARIVRQGSEGETLSYLSNGCDVWNTALALETLVQARALGFEVSEPAISKAVRWIAGPAHQCIQPAVESPGRGRLRRGGWAFELANTMGPDTDSTALVLRALATYLNNSPEADRVPGVHEAMEAGRQWLTGMQHKDGGWGAFMADQPKAPRELLFQYPMMSTESVDFWNPVSLLRFLRVQLAQLGDRSTASLTARVVEGLIVSGTKPADQAIVHALDFVRSHQHGGKWFGRWTVNYVPATAYVVRAMGKLGYLYDPSGSQRSRDPNHLALRRAVEWLSAVQRVDGGWGDTPASYSRPELAGVAPRSMPGLTGLVLEALVTVGVEGDVVDRGAQYLLSAQHAEGVHSGVWDGDGWVQVFFPPNTLYLFPFANVAAPLRGLLAYYARVQMRSQRAELPQLHRVAN